MLANGNSLAETAYTLSFSDQSHYARSFKQVFGVSPDKLRKKIVLKNNEEF
jgi:AraC-like DNA-binding protein